MPMAAAYNTQPISQSNLSTIKEKNGRLSYAPPTNKRNLKIEIGSRDIKKKNSNERSMNSTLKMPIGNFSCSPKNSLKPNIPT